MAATTLFVLSLLATKISAFNFRPSLFATKAGQYAPRSAISRTSAGLLRAQQRRVRRVRHGEAAKATVEPRPISTTAVNGEEILVGTETSPEDEAEWPYDWRKHWYAVGYDRDIVEGPKPFGVSIFDEPLVLYRDNSGALQCVSDFCPHRASRLSEGQVTEEGNIECLYHGWQFEGSTGSCVKIPQLPEGGVAPRAACLRVYPVAVSEGIVFVWMGNDPWGEGAKDILPVPTTADRIDENKPSFTYEFVYDVPYDWSYLAENLLDPAHIPISHHATQGGGNKENAAPIDFRIKREGKDAPGSGGFSALVVSQSPFAKRTTSTTDYKWEAPCVIRVRGEPKKPDGPVFGAALHCIPLGKGRARLLFKTYGLRFPKIAGIILDIKPLFLRHLNSCKILEQDMKLICAQEDHVARTGESLSNAFLPIKSSDGLVVELRKWLDHVGHGMPFYQGWKKSKQAADLNDHEDTRRATHRAQESRYHRHVLVSAHSRRALGAVKRVKKGGLAAAMLLSAASLLLLSTNAGGAAARAAAAAAGSDAIVSRVWGARAAVATAAGAVCSLGLAAVASLLEESFYTNFERHPVLR